MAIINWDESLSVNNEEIDNQHKKLISIINELYDSIQGRRDSEILETIFAELVSYTVYHFDAEEKIMESSEYKGLLDHQKSHKEFIATVSSFKEKYDRGESSLSIEIINFLKGWVINHILKEDAAYKPYI